MGPVPSIECPRCGHSNPDGASRCTACDNAISSSGQENLTLTDGGWSRAAAPARSAPTDSLPSGTVLSGRYQILDLIGQGGMGAVYKALDNELDRVVAVKVIRSDLAADPKILQRFKQELILARQVTHKNVIRIFDLGTTGAVKYITMEYVEGRDLSSLTEERRFTPEEVARIIRQVCRALDAAHAEKVIHRDLKPQNIMLDGSGRVLVMDFGLARSFEMSGLTQSGAVLGTPAYMSPEQAKGQPVDARSDIFSLGIIFYELLTGQTPFKADTVWATLLSRTQAPPPPPAEVDPSVPKPLSDIVLKCLAIPAAERYEDAAAIIADLDAWIGDSRSGAVPIAPSREPEPVSVAGAPRRKWAAPVAAVLALAFGGGGFGAYRMWSSRPVAKPKAVTVLLADFKNNTADPVFNGTLEPALTVDLEGAPFLSVYSRSEARRLAATLQPGNAGMDETLARLVAQRQGIGVVVSGAISRDSSGYEISERAIDPFTGRVIATERVSGTSKDGVLSATARLAARLRKSLGDDTPEGLQMAAAETFSAGSLEAAHAYADAERLERDGKSQEAIDAYLKAVELDPNLGRAYASLAAVSADMGNLRDAEKYHSMAMSRIDRMSDREKYKTLGIYHLIVRDHRKAIDELTSLTRQYPADAGGLKNLALAHFFARDLPHALEVGRRAVQIYPHDVKGLNNVALYAMYAGDFQTAGAEARKVIEMSPSFVRAYLALALSELAQDRPEQAAAAYRRMETIDAQGESMAAIGLADLAMYQGRFGDARAVLEKMAKPAPRGQIMLAELAQLRGDSAQAAALVEKAVPPESEEDLLYSAARIYIQAGRESSAEKMEQALAKRTGGEAQLYAALVRGELLLKRGKAAEAAQVFQTALKSADAWLAHFDLGRAWLQAKSYTEAYAEFETAMKRRGEATAVFLDDVPSYRWLPHLQYEVAMTQKALGSPEAAQSFRKILAMKSPDGGDPLVAAVKRQM